MIPESFWEKPSQCELLGCPNRVHDIPNVRQAEQAVPPTELDTIHIIDRLEWVQRQIMDIVEEIDGIKAEIKDDWKES